MVRMASGDNDIRPARKGKEVNIIYPFCSSINVSCLKLFYWAVDKRNGADSNIPAFLLLQAWLVIILWNCLGNVGCYRNQDLLLNCLRCQAASDKFLRFSRSKISFYFQSYPSIRIDLVQSLMGLWPALTPVAVNGYYLFQLLHLYGCGFPFDKKPYNVYSEENCFSIAENPPINLNSYFSIGTFLWIYIRTMVSVASIIYCNDA